MDTKIKCRECGREMDFWEFMPYLETYLLKLAIASGLVAFLTEAAKNYFLTKQQTKGFIDGRMATYANLLEVKCPKCKDVGVWDPISLMEPVVEIKKEIISKNTKAN